MTRNKRTLQLDKANAKWLGVCAGLANFLEVEAWTVRVVFLGCLFFGGWFLVPLYFITWYLLDEKSGDVKERIMENQAVKHFRSVDYRKKLYRNTQDGKVFGVCAGIADYLEVNVFAVRLVFVVLTFLAAFPIILYIGAAMVLEKKPLEEYQYEARSRMWTTQFSREDGETSGESRRRSDDVAGSAGARPFESRRSESKRARDHFSQRREFQYCARKFSTLQKRLVRLEAYVTSSKFKLQREFRSM